VTHLVETTGLPLLFLLIMLESAGIPLPGETALIGAAVLAERGHFDIAAVIAVAAAAAIIGDNAGYWVARRWGRDLLLRSKRLGRFAKRVLPPSERFFERHGSKTVFFGRFLPILRFTAAWLAGITRMHWWTFLLWNAAGGICWATGVGLVSFYFGRTVTDAYDRYGYIAVLVALAILGSGFGVLHRLRKRALREGSASRP